ncbi:hypothetical protein AB0J83_34645 [Actinoplanes sp. NPDC049596]|uniref:hypothetical protein n=1 Tax=unclassified Actinoplanes TaxID=2626549 RepID=UPI00344837D4
MNRPLLIPGLPRVWRDNIELQLGADPARAVLLRLPDHRAAEILDLLDGTRPERTVLLRAAELGIPIDEAQAVLDFLQAAGLARPATALIPRKPTGAIHERLISEAAALAFHDRRTAPIAWPAAQRAAAHHAAAQQAAAQQAAAQQAAAQQAAAQQAATRRPTAQSPTAHRASGQTTASQSAATQNAPAQSAATQNAATQNTATQNATAHSAATQNAATQNAATQNAATQNATAKNATAHGTNGQSGTAEHGTGQNAASPRAAGRAARSPSVRVRTPATTLRRRQAASVVITGRGRLGAPIAVALAEAGVGHVLPDISGTVRTEELAGGPLREDDVGKLRRDAVIEALTRVMPEVSTRRLRTTRPALVIQLDHDGPAPLVAAAHAGREQPHLSVTIREGAAVIGPLVPRTGGPCLACLELHRLDRDADWPGPARSLTPEPCTVTTLLAATAYATAEALTFLDGDAPETLGASVEITTPGRSRRRTWPPHPDCDCTTRRRPTSRPTPTSRPATTPRPTPAPRSVSAPRSTPAPRPTPAPRRSAAAGQSAPEPRPAPAAQPATAPHSAPAPGGPSQRRNTAEHHGPS